MSELSSNVADDLRLRNRFRSYPENPVDSQDTRSIGVYGRSSRDELSLALCPLDKSLIIQAVSHFSPHFSPRTRGIDRLISLAPFYLSLSIKTRATYVRKRDDLRGGSL